MSQMRYDVIVVDCLNLAHRNWWARRALKTTTGVYTGLEYGFLSGLLNIMKKYPGAKLFLVWDGIPVRCRDIFPEYKLHRQPIKERALEPDWGPRIQLLRELLADVFSTVYHPETEADEEIARITWCHNDINVKTLIFSNDKDMHQLVTANIHVCPFEKDASGNDLIYDYELMKDKWGVFPERIPLYRSLLGAGDVSDGIQGIPRFPKRLALEIVYHCENLVKVLEFMKTGLEHATANQKEKIRDTYNQELVARNYSLMELLTQKGYEAHFLPVPTGNLTKIWDLCQILEFRSLTDRFEWRTLGAWPGASHARNVSAGRYSSSGEI